MKTIKKDTRIEFVERKSRFIGWAKSVDDREKAEEFIEEIRKKHSDATHNVYAYSMNNGKEYLKFSDDGEPKDTAGKPIIELIKIKDINNVVVVVTRYFGGIKLGAGGLIRNYAKAAKLALEEADETEIIPTKNIIIEFNYDKVNAIEQVLEKYNINEDVKKEYAEKVKFIFEASDECVQEIKKFRDVIVVE